MQHKFNISKKHISFSPYFIPPFHVFERVQFLKSITTINLLALLVFLLSPIYISAQSEGALSIGLTTYQGDLQSISDNNIKIFQELNPSFGLNYKYKINENWGLRANLNYTGLSGSDSNFEDIGHQRRNFSFNSDILELSTMLQWEVLGKKRYTNGSFQKILTPYLFGGIGAAFVSYDVNFNEASNIGIISKINIDKEANSVLLILPVGLGLRYDLNERFGLAVETGIRLPVSDYYDGVSEAANPERNDIYGIGAVKLIFQLAQKDLDNDGTPDKADKCPGVVGSTLLEGCPDKDKDGIRDSEDVCPDIAGKAENNGCPDTDNDGVIDEEDLCPAKAGLAEFNGCPDTDQDGLADPDDACPEEKGTKKNDGCPDTDGDNIIDKYDACPNERGVLSEKGCPVKDADKDGIPDEDDACPNEKGTIENKGCAFGDKDKDGVRDDVDKCPNEAGLVENAGCPKLKAIDKALLKQATEDVRFNTNGNVLATESKAILDKIAKLMSSTSGTLVIRGYTDSVGSESYNLRLSERRSKACFDYLVSKGVLGKRMTSKGYGEIDPIASNDTEEGRYQNRRVTFELIIK